MATVHRDDIARLVPADPPGAELAAIYRMAAEAWPTIRPTSVLTLLRSLRADGLAVQVNDPAGPPRYHLTEPR